MIPSFFPELLRLVSSVSVEAIKVETEEEGASYEDIQDLSLACIQIPNISLNVKIGGVAALSDMQFLTTVGCSGIIAPMCESLYGCEKFIDYCSDILPRKKKYLLLETINGIAIAKDIIKCFSKDIDGIIIGRGDLSRAMSFQSEHNITIHDTKIYNIVADIFNFSKDFDSKLVTALGGGIDKLTIKNLSNGEYDCIDFVESRKVVLRKSSIADESIDQALRFEMEYLKSKARMYEARSAQANARILKLASRLES